MASEALIVYCTLPDDDRSVELCRTLVGEKLAACVNLIPAVQSIYRWKGQICDDPERLAIIKTTAARFESLRARIVELHPYECPEVVSVEIEEGHAPYLAWIVEMTS